MKRYLVLLSLCLLVGFFTAGTAFGQVQFNTAGGNQVVRGEGHTETVNSVTILTTTGGTLKAGTTINYDFSPAAVTSPVDSVTLNCSADFGLNCVDLTATVSGNRVTLTQSSGADLALAAGAFVTVSGIRVDVAGMGTGFTTVNCILSSTPASALVTYNPTIVPVAIVINPSISVDFTEAKGILTCNPPTAAAVSQFEIDVTELTQHALTTYLEEQSYTPKEPLAQLLNGTQVTVSIVGVPNTTTVSFDGLTAASTVTATASAASKKSTGATTPLVFTFTITGETAGLDLMGMLFSVYQASGTMPLGAQTITATVFLSPVGPIASTPANTPALLFNEVDHTANVDSVSDCVTNLLFPWVVLVPGLGYDTGISIANTTMDPFAVGGASPQTGTCTLYGYSTAVPSAPAAPAAAITYTTPAVPSGASWANSLSGITAFNAGNFTGYVIAICNFQNAHGFAFISENLTTPSGIAQGYVGLVIPSPSILPRNPATFLGLSDLTGAGEGLAQ